MRSILPWILPNGSAAYLFREGFSGAALPGESSQVPRYRARILGCGVARRYGNGQFVEGVIGMRRVAPFVFLTAIAMILSACRPGAGAGRWQALTYRFQGGIMGADTVISLSSAGEWKLMKGEQAAAGGSLEAEVLARLTGLVKEVKWEEVEPKYSSDGGAADQLTRTVSLRRGERSYQTVVLGPAAVPEALRRLLEFLDSLRATIGPPPDPGSSAFLIAPHIEGDSIYVRQAGRSRKLLSLSDLPGQAAPAGTSYEFQVGRDSFSEAVASRGTGRVGFFTRGVHPLFGVFDLSSNRMIPLDLYFEGQGLEIAWSPAGDLVATEARSPAGVSIVLIYDLAAAKRFDAPFRREFPPPRYSLALEGWRDSRTLLVKVQPGSRPGAEPGKTGRWSLDLLTWEFTRIP